MLGTDGKKTNFDGCVTNLQKVNRKTFHTETYSVDLSTVPCPTLSE